MQVYSAVAKLPLSTVSYTSYEILSSVLLTQTHYTKFKHRSRLVLFDLL